MSRLPRLAVFVGCAFAAFVALETLRWTRPIALLVARFNQPMAVVSAEGVVELAVTEQRRDADGSVTEDWHVYDKAGRPVGLADPRSENPLLVLGPYVRERVGGGSNPWKRFALCDVRVDAPSAEETVLRALRSAQGWSFFADPDEAMRQVLRFRAESRPAPWWTFEDRRFVCRDLNTGGVLAGFGPDGFSRGADGAKGERFAGALVSIGHWGWYSSVSSWSPGAPAAAPIGTLLDSSGRRIHFLRVEHPKDAPERGGPVQVGVSTVRVEGPAGEPPVSAADGWLDWAGRYGSRDAADLTVTVGAGRDLCRVRADGIAHRISLADDEREALPSSHEGCVANVLAPVGGPVGRMRVRCFTRDGGVIVDDVETIPVTTGGRVGAACVGAVSCLRPPALSAASWLGPAPADYDDYFSRRLTDGVVAGREETGWLLGGLAVAALCGWFVRRQARMRDPARVALWTAVGAAGGLLGLMFMRIAMRKSHVAACACGRSRAVHVESCPTCAARWPAPAATGVEVFG